MSTAARPPVKAETSGPKACATAPDSNWPSCGPPVVKTELTEKVCQFGHNVVPAAIGGFVAYTGATLLLFGMGLAAAFGFQKLGLEPLLAGRPGEQPAANSET